MTATSWNDAFFASDVEFDHLPAVDDGGRRFPSDLLPQTQSAVSAIIEAASANIIGLTTALVLMAGTHALSNTRVVEDALEREVGVGSLVEAPTSVQMVIPDDVLEERAQNLPALARVLLLGQRAEGLDHLL